MLAELAQRLCATSAAMTVAEFQQRGRHQAMNAVSWPGVITSNLNGGGLVRW
jgi:hypothetical protein